MLKPFGACLIIFCTGWLGLREALRIRRIARDADTALRLLSRTETLVLLSHTPLPHVLRSLRAEMPSLFPAGLPESDMDVSYSDIWMQCVQRMPLAGSVQTPLLLFGESIFSGDDPAAAFSEARERLKAEREDSLRKWKDYGKLYSSLGFVIGCFLVILLA